MVCVFASIDEVRRGRRGQCRIVEIVEALIWISQTSFLPFSCISFIKLINMYVYFTIILITIKNKSIHIPKRRN